MRLLRKITAVFAIAGIVFLVSGDSHAQDAEPDDVAADPAPADDTAPDDTAPDDTALDDTAPEDTAPEDTAPEDTAPEDTADVTVPMEKRAELTPSAMVAAAEELIRGMQKMLTRVVQLQQIARRQKDVIKLNCVNDKLLQVKQLLNIAEGASTNMHEAIAQEDEDARYHEYGKIVIAQQQVTLLVGEAESCVGEELVFIGPTEVDADEPEPADDPTQDEPDYDLEPPGYASPFA